MNIVSIENFASEFTLLCKSDLSERLRNRYLHNNWHIPILQPNVYCARVHEVAPFGRSFMFRNPDEVAFHCQSYQNYKHNAGLPSIYDHFIHQFKNTTSHVIDEECIFVGGMDCELEPDGSYSFNKADPSNFGNFLLEYLTRASIFDMVGLLDRRIVLWNELPRRYIDWLTLAGFRTSDPIFIPARGPTYFKDMYVASCPNYRGADGKFRMWAEGVYQLRQRMFKAVGGPYITGPKLLFLSRGQAKTRNISNESSVRTILEDQGFIGESLSGCSAAYQVRIVSGADIIVTTCGAASPIMQFAPEGATIIHLAPRKIGTGPWGGSGYATILNQIYERIDGESIPSTDGRPMRLNGANVDELADYEINLEQLAQVIQYAKARVEQTRRTSIINS